ncbi:MAG: hypothetical protein CYG60_06510 [Actinobacteria bacterium]|nr:MAG: hypothetical protein CYG60_06510 [Actinomycetota bacterium]
MGDDKRVGAKGQPEPSTWLTSKDVQEELRLGEKSVYRLLKSGAIPSVRLGGVYRINRRHLEDAPLTGADSRKSA